MDKIHHIAIQVQDIRRAVEWYKSRFACEVSYQDESWAMLEFDNVKLALVIPSEHPYHIAFAHGDAAKFGELTTHRDGIASIYLEDSEGNSVEIIDGKTLKNKMRTESL